MKRLSLMCMAWLPMASMAMDVCNSESDTKHFLSQWSESRDNKPDDILSGLHKDQFSVEYGKVVYRGDLNDDGQEDFIFTSYSSRGSAGDSTFAFLIQCHGYLKHVGGDYFARVKVLDGPPKNGGDFKDIAIYSYVRDKRDQISYMGKDALTRRHLWQFNPQTQRYEGQSE
ncbi:MULTISPECIES: hypothetical protein [unclassified Pseudomonas]|nr:MULTISPECIES: hypothetical protein [unclassified Pseudomonas]